MAKLRDDFARQVEALKGHVSQREYADAIDTLKALGGEIGAFAALHAALIGAATGAFVAVGYVGAAMGPIAWSITFVTAMSTISLSYAFAASLLNQWYDELSTENRVALTKTIAYGIAKSRMLLRMWKMVAR